MEDQTLLRALQEELHEFQSLLEHPGWKRLANYATVQVDGRLNDLILSVETKTKEVHYARGEMAGIRLFSRIPIIEVNRLKEDIQKLTAREEETEHENQPPESAP